MKLRTNLIFVFAATSLVARSAVAQTEAPDPAARHRLVAILDYVASDYPGAVKDGKVESQSELEEQIAFAEQALELAETIEPKAPDALFATLRDLVAACKSVAPADRVEALAQAARRQVVERYGLLQSPSALPSLERGAALYQAGCAICHGPQGVPAPDKLEALKPPPRTLSDRAAIAAISPYRAFNDLAFGVEGTSMASFQVLSEGERWDLAFFAMTLRADPKPSLTYPRSLADLSVLSSSTDDQLRKRLRDAKVADVEGALDALRINAPYSRSAAESPINATRRLLDQGLTAAREGHRAQARGLWVDAYLQGFERAESRLRSRDSALVDQVEAQFLRVRAALDSGREATLDGEIETLRRLLARSEYLLDSGNEGPWVGFVAGALLIVREGVEAALLVLLLLTSVAGVGRSDAARYVHAGWLSALAAGGVTFAVAQRATRWLGLSSELVEAVASLAAAGVLFYVSNWLIGQLQAARWMSFVKDRMKANLSAGRLLAIFGIAFLAVFREAVETVLFFEGLLAGAERPSAVVAGAATGGVGLTIVVVALRRLGNRLPLRAFFTASSVLLYSLCVILAGKGVHALIAAGAVSPHPWGRLDLPTIGVFPDALTLTVQSLLVGLVVVSIVWTRHRKNDVSSPAHRAAGA